MNLYLGGGLVALSLLSLGVVVSRMAANAAPPPANLAVHRSRIPCGGSPMPDRPRPILGGLHHVYSREPSELIPSFPLPGRCGKIKLEADCLVTRG
jgi:hypothetical protein